MKKRYGIYFIKEEGGFYAFGLIYKICNTYEEAEEAISKLDLKSSDIITIVPIYSATNK